MADIKQKIGDFLQKKGDQHNSVLPLATKFFSETAYYLNVKEISFPKICIVAWFKSRVVL